MKNKLWAAVLAAAVLLTGCSLAQPEKEGKSQDRLVGLYVVRYESMEQANEFFDNPHLVEHGSISADTEYGAVSLPDHILVGRYDKEAYTYIFPGLKRGWGLFTVDENSPEGRYNRTICDMDSSGSAYRTNDDGESVELEGTLYVGPPEGAGPDWDPYADDGTYWRYYQVYQMEDGTVYLDGSGDSTSGGGGWGYSIEGSTTVTRNGESTTKSVKATVNMETAQRLEGLTVTWFGQEDLPVLSQELPPAPEETRLHAPEGAVWVLVEEHYGTGVDRAAYTLPGKEEDPALHTFAVLDDEGTGRSLTLSFEAEE